MTPETRNQRIEGTNLYIFSKNAETGLFTYARPMLEEEAQAVMKATNHRIYTDYPDAPGIKGTLTVANSGLANMSTLKGIVANQELMRQSKGTIWLPTIQEGRILSEAHLLPSGELCDFGLAVYSDSNPDKEIAVALTRTAQEKNYALPLLASFKSLSLTRGGEHYGVIPTVTSEQGLITGTDAQKLLKKFDYTANTGVHRVGRDRDGGWVADWYGNLDCCDADYRVGNVVAEGSAQKIEALVEAQVKAKFTTQRADLEAKIKDLATQEQATITSATNILK